MADEELRGVEPEVAAVEAEPGGVPEPSPVEPSAGVAEAAPAASSSADAGGWTGVREYAKQFGVELPHENDAAALGELLQAYRGRQERDYYADLGRRLAPHAAEVQQYLAQREAAPAAAERPKYRPPEFRQEWLNMVERDPETGALRAKAGYDPALAERVQAFAEWREGFLTRPDEYLGPLVEERAAELVRRELGSYQERLAADEVLRENAGWLYRRDAEGRPVPGPGGRPELTPEGQLFAQAVEHLSRQGLRDPRETARLARAVVENQVLRRELARQRPAEAQAAAPGATRAAGRNGHQAMPAAGSTATTAASDGGLSLREMLRRNLDAAGIREDAEVAF